MSKIYTKKGDCGETSLGNSKKVPKNHICIEALGVIDEVNALIGVVINQLNNTDYLQQLKDLQYMLFEIGTSLARPDVKSRRPDMADIILLEKRIDDMTKELPLLTSFILPGGSKTASVIHLARTVTRRAERRVITVSQHQSISPYIIKYLNRLSDYLFTLARAVNLKENVSETLWQQDEI